MSHASAPCDMPGCQTPATGGVEFGKVRAVLCPAHTEEAMRMLDRMKAERDALVATGTHPRVAGAIISAKLEKGGSKQWR
jgi:hypothetical protein